MNSQIYYAFKIYVTDLKFPIMFSKLNDGNYTKTFMNDKKLDIHLITQQEYAFALAYYNFI
jgi:hypothetical protein